MDNKHFQSHLWQLCASLFFGRWIFCRAFMDCCHFFYHVKQAIVQPFTLCSVFISCKCDDTLAFNLHPTSFCFKQSVCCHPPLAVVMALLTKSSHSDLIRATSLIPIDLSGRSLLGEVQRRFTVSSTLPYNNSVIVVLVTFLSFFCPFCKNDVHLCTTFIPSLCRFICTPQGALWHALFLYAPRLTQAKNHCVGLLEVFF